jgi:hypothetical protein
VKELDNPANEHPETNSDYFALALGLAENQNNVSEWSGMSTLELLFQ